MKLTRSMLQEFFWAADDACSALEYDLGNEACWCPPTAKSRHSEACQRVRMVYERLEEAVGTLGSVLEKSGENGRRV